MSFTDSLKTLAFGQDKAAILRTLEEFREIRDIACLLSPEHPEHAEAVAWLAWFGLLPGGGGGAQGTWPTAGLPRQKHVPEASAAPHGCCRTKAHGTLVTFKARRCCRAATTEPDGHDRGCKRTCCFKCRATCLRCRADYCGPCRIAHVCQGSQQSLLDKKAVSSGLDRRRPVAPDTRFQDFRLKIVMAWLSENRTNADLIAGLDGWHDVLLLGWQRTGQPAIMELARHLARLGVMTKEQAALWKVEFEGFKAKSKCAGGASGTAYRELVRVDGRLQTISLKTI